MEKVYGMARFANKKEIEQLRDEETAFFWKDYADENSDLVMPKTGNGLSFMNHILGVKQKELIDSAGSSLSVEGVRKLFEKQKASNAGDPNMIIGVTNDGAVIKRMNSHRLCKFNGHTLVVGGTGKGKDSAYLIPNLMQAESSFIVPDSTGELLNNIGSLLVNHGYKIKVLSMNTGKNTDYYNPLDYIYSNGVVDGNKVRDLVEILIHNADETKKGSRGGDDFWKKAPYAIMTALVYYCADFLPAEERTMSTIYKLLNDGKIDEDKSMNDTRLHKLFEEAREKNPDSKCFDHYKIYQLLPAKTANAILISLGVDLVRFTNDEIYERVIGKLDISDITSEKTAIFVSNPNSCSESNFLEAALYWQILDIVGHTDFSEDMRPFRFVFEDNVGYFPSFYRFFWFNNHCVYATVMTRSLSYLRQALGEQCDCALGDCDVVIYMGTTDEAANEYVAGRIGRIDYASGRTEYLLNPDDIMMIPNDSEIVIIRGGSFGQMVLNIKKYDVRKHPFFSETALADKKNAFVYGK